MAETARLARAARGHLSRALGPLWRNTFRDPVREGRLRLTGLSWAERHAARVALVSLAVVLGSTLFATAWRRGALLTISGRSDKFVPAGVLGLTLAAFAVSWLVITWGGLRGSGPVRALVGLAYLLLNADFLVDLAVYGSHSWVVQHYAQLQKLGFYGPAVALLVASLTTRWAGLDKWVVRAARLVCLAGTAVLFLGLLWTHADQVDAGMVTATTTVSGALLTIGVVLLPLVYVSAVAVIDFALDVSTSLAEPAAGWGRRWLGLVVLGLVAAKLWFHVGTRTDYWRTALSQQPQAVVRTAVSVALLGVLTVGLTRFRHSDDSLIVKEDLTQGSSLVLSVPYVGEMLTLAAAVLVTAVQQRHSLPGWYRDFPANWLNSWGLLIASAVALVAGIVLMARSRGGRGDELGSGLVLVGAWGTALFGISDSGLDLGISYPSVDLTVTLGVLLAVLVRWRRAEPAFLLAAATVLVFSWLATSRGDYLSVIGGLVGLPGLVVVVFGIVWTLLSGSSFVTGTSRWLPQPARPQLFLGYVLLSVAILNWNETTHQATSDADAFRAYFTLGIPLGAWLVGRRVVARPDRTPQANEALEAVPRDPGH